MRRLILISILCLLAYIGGRVEERRNAQAACLALSGEWVSADRLCLREGPVE